MSGGKLNPTTHDWIVTAVRTGSSISAAARSAGVTANTVARWMDRGKVEPDGKYHEFAKALKKARARLESDLTRQWVKIVTEPRVEVTREFKEVIVRDSRGEPEIDDDGQPRVVRLLVREKQRTIGGGDWQGISAFLSVSCKINQGFDDKDRGTVIDPDRLSDGTKRAILRDLGVVVEDVVEVIDAVECESNERMMIPTRYKEDD